jgi:hypothetical protein
MPSFRGKRVTHKGYSPSQGSDVGKAMADGIKSMTYASKDTLTEDADGLLPSDHIMQAMGNELERRGAKRL